MIRRELSIELVKVHGISQAEVARLLELTDAAISQYLRMKRGGTSKYCELKEYSPFSEELKKSAVLIVEGADTIGELCRLCGVVKKCGLLAAIYNIQTGAYPPSCVE